MFQLSVQPRPQGAFPRLWLLQSRGKRPGDEVVECRAYILTRERNEENEDYVNCGNTNSNEDMIIAVGQPNGSVKMNSANMPAAPNVWVFIAQLVGYCSANAEAMGSNPVELPQFFFGLTCSFSNCNYHCDDHIFI